MMFNALNKDHRSSGARTFPPSSRKAEGLSGTHGLPIGRWIPDQVRDDEVGTIELCGDVGGSGGGVFNALNADRVGTGVECALAPVKTAKWPNKKQIEAWVGFSRPGLGLRLKGARNCSSQYRFHRAARFASLETAHTTQAFNALNIKEAHHGA
ncbi:MAG: hypothetical protein AAGH41_11400 [Pseudomonadota bacterium]